MHLRFIKDLFRIISKRHLDLKQRISLLKTFVYLKSLHRNIEKNKDVRSVNMLNYSVCFDNLGDLFATFYEIFINEEYYGQNYSDYDLIIDAGANIGLATLYFKWISPEVRIIGFEMDEDTFVFYEKNVSINSLENVEIHRVAIGRNEGDVISHGSRRATTLNRDLARNLTEKAEPERSKVVTVKKLSDFLPDKGHVYLKLDVEGAEVDVIKELFESNSLSNVMDMTFEFHYIENHIYKNLESILVESGFKVYKQRVQKNGHSMVSANKN